MATMTVYVRVPASAAVLGDGRHGDLPVTLDLDTLTEAQRKGLSLAIQDTPADSRDTTPTPYLRPLIVGGNPGSRGLHATRSVLSLPAATPQAIATALDDASAELVRQVAQDARREEERRAQRDEERARAEAWAALPLAWRATADGVATCRPTLSRTDYHGPLAISGCVVISIGTLAEHVPAALAEAKSEARRLDEARGAESRARVEAQKNALRAWAMARGSDRLRALIEEDFSWEGVAEDEFFAANTPHGFLVANDMPGDDWSRKERTKPALEEIQALRSLRRDCEGSNGVLSTPALEYAIATYEADEDGEKPDPEKFPMLSVTITAPNGKTREVFRRLP